MFTRLMIVLAVVVGLTEALIAQQKPIHFKKLQEFLPKEEITGYVRGKPTGKTETLMMGMATSEAAVEYRTPVPEEDEAMGHIVETSSIEVRITDNIAIPGFAFGAMYQQQGYERETEEGYEKSTKVQGYPTVEKAQTGEYKTCELTITVANRFVVELRLTNSDQMVLIKGLVKKMDLKGLGKIAEAETEEEPEE